MDRLKKRILVIDSPAFINLKIPLQPLGNTVYVTTPGVLNELKDRMSELHASVALMQRVIKVESPSESSLKEIKKVLRILGEDISRTDISVVALALDYKKRGENVAILTDDYSLANVANYMDLKVKLLTKKEFKSVIKWRYQCPSCKRYFKEKKRCPFCDVELIRKGRRIRSVDP